MSFEKARDFADNLMRFAISVALIPLAVAGIASLAFSVFDRYPLWTLCFFAFFFLFNIKDVYGFVKERSFVPLVFRTVFVFLLSAFFAGLIAITFNTTVLPSFRMAFWISYLIALPIVTVIAGAFRFFPESKFSSGLRRVYDGLFATRIFPSW